MAIEVSDVLESLGRSRRYRHIAPALLARVAGEEIVKSKNLTEAEKRSKRRLHQIFGAYAAPLRYEKLLRELEGARGNDAALKDVCAAIMRRHASTAERLADLEGFYERIFALTGRPGSILDLACGLNPLTLPWMGLAPGARYAAADIDLDMMSFIGQFLGMMPAAGVAMVNDLVSRVPDDEADVALLLKSLPCLEHQTTDVAGILQRINARRLVVSFPTRSLGNRPKGMEANYREYFTRLLRAKGWESRELVFESELVFVVERDGGCRPSGGS